MLDLPALVDIYSVLSSTTLTGMETVYLFVHLASFCLYVLKKEKKKFLLD